jgi:hypothetical protein
MNMHNDQTKLLWQAVQDARRAEAAATKAHDEAERLGSGPAYQAAFDALVDARASLEAAESLYDEAVEEGQRLDN